MDGALAAQTPFVTLIANSLTRNTTRNVSFGKTPLFAPPDRLQMGLTTYFDPKLQVQQSVVRTLKIQQKGEAAPQAPDLAPGQRFAFNLEGRSGGGIAPFTLQLPASLEPKTVLSLVSGVLHCEIVAETRPFAVADIEATPEAAITIAGAQYQLLRVTKTANIIKIKLQITENLATQPFRVNNTFVNLRVRDAQGHPLLSSSTRISSKGGEFSFRLKDRKKEAAPGPYSLDWPIVTAIKSLDVPFELRDITVP